MDFDFKSLLDAALMESKSGEKRARQMDLGKGEEWQGFLMKIFLVYLNC